jgi:hypothetical protein
VGQPVEHWRIGDHRLRRPILVEWWLFVDHILGRNFCGRIRNSHRAHERNCLCLPGGCGELGRARRIQFGEQPTNTVCVHYFGCDPHLRHELHSPGRCNDNEGLGCRRWN